MQSFQDLNLSPLLEKAVLEMGFESPTPIQAQTIPILLAAPTDFLGLAATGTGKTVAFGIPLLEKIDPKKRVVQGLILCPTRELALQVAGQIDLLGKHLGVRALPIYGGSPYGEQIRGLKNGAQIVVGTPGRVVDHLEKGTLNLSQLHTVILDEADEMISMGFKEDLENILSNTPREQSQIWFFCATMSSEVRKVVNEYLRDPEQVQVNRTEMVPDRIDQIYYRAHEGDKPEIVCKLIDAADDFYGIIFCQTKALVADLTQYLKSRDYRVDCLHGDMDQNARERTMQSFRDRKVTLLVCTDVASRGLDVKDITHVINYSIPRELDNYVHRIGRTARSGKTGFAMSLVTPSHRVLISRIENMTKSKMREGKLPTRKEIGMKKISNVLVRFEAQKNFSRAVELLSDAWKTAIAEMSSEEIVGRFLSLDFPEVFEDRKEPEYQPRPPVKMTNVKIDSRKDHQGGGSDRGDRSERYGRPERRDYAKGPALVANPANSPVKVAVQFNSKLNITLKPVELDLEYQDDVLDELEIDSSETSLQHEMIRPPSTGVIQVPQAPTGVNVVAPKKNEHKKFVDKASYAARKFPDGKKFAEKKFSDKKWEDKKPAGKPFGNKPYGEKKFGEKKFGDKPYGEKKFGDKKFGDKKFSDKKFGDKGGYSARKYGASSEKPHSFSRKPAGKSEWQS